MSIELLPPDPEYPNAYHVRSNWCRCHPETCCCNDWAVHKPDGSKHSTYFHRDEADEAAEALNLKAANDGSNRPLREAGSQNDAGPQRSG